MIARKIVFQGELNRQSLETIYDIVRRIEITGELKMSHSGTIEVDLEGDPSMIKLAQHQIVRRLKKEIKSVAVTQNPFRNYSGLSI